MKFYATNYLLTLLLLTCAQSAQAQLIDPRQAIELEADSTQVDTQTGNLVFNNISVRQGDLRIVSDRAESTSIGFENDTWKFNGNVGIESADSTLSADLLTVDFRNKKINNATLRGSPLTFKSTTTNETTVLAVSAIVDFAGSEVQKVMMEGAPIEITQVSGESGKLMSGQANSIIFNAITRDLQLMGNAVLGEGSSQIAGNEITYNLDSRTVNAAASEDGADRIHITIQPSDQGSLDDIMPVTTETPEQDQTE